MNFTDKKTGRLIYGLIAIVVIISVLFNDKLSEYKRIELVIEILLFFLMIIYEILRRKRKK